MAADYLWLWDNVNSVWVKAQCDADGKLIISDLTFPTEYPLPASQVADLKDVDVGNFPADYPLPAAQVADLKAITSYPDPIISQTTPINLRHVPHGYYAAGTSYLPYAVDSAGKLLLSIAALQHLSDIADVNLTGLTTGDFIYWDAATSKWERIAHASAVTGVHGLALGARVYHSASQTISNNTETILAFDSESYDTDAIHDNSTNNSRLTCKTAGKYLIFCQAYWAGNATGARQIIIVHSTMGNIGMALCDAYSANGFIQICQTIYDMTVNTYVEFKVAQVSGGNLVCYCVSENNTHFWMQRVG